MDHCPEGRDPPYWRVSIVSPHRRWISGWNRNLLVNWHRLTALEAIARLPPAGAPIIRSWSAADTALCISTIVGYVMNLTLAFLLHKRVNVVQESLNKCTSGVPRLFDVVIPTETPNPRIWTTWLRSCLYRLVEPLTIKTVKNDPIVNNDKQCIPMSSQVSNLFLPKLPCTRF